MNATDLAIQAAAAQGAWNERQRIIALAEKCYVRYLVPDHGWRPFADLLREDNHPGCICRRDGEGAYCPVHNNCTVGAS